jgi:TRAP-type mannitol/chloroaromatic compound transport system permease small subunit
MAKSTVANGSISSEGGTLIVRLVGWNVLAFILGLLVNNVLSVAFNFPGVMSIFTGVSSQNLFQLVVYLISFLLVSYVNVFHRSNTLRQDAALIHNINLFIIRGFFWSVLFIGIIDVTIAFLRVEKILIMFASERVISLLNKPMFVGGYIHVPIFIFSFFLAGFTRTLGFVWLALLIVLAELVIVISRFVFSYEQPFMADLVRYWYAALFLFSSAFTLYDEGHVRVDIVYAGLIQKTKGMLNAIGCILLGLSTSLTIIVIAFNGKYSIINKPVMSFEVSQTGTVGMFVKYQLALFLGIFGITMAVQFVSYFMESIADYREDTGKRLVHQETAH